MIVPTRAAEKTKLESVLTGILSARETRRSILHGHNSVSLEYMVTLREKEKNN